MFAPFDLSSRLVHWGSRGIGSNGSSVTVSLSRLRRVDRGALVADLSDKAVDVVGGVLGCLDPAVRQSNHIGSSHNTVGILGLSLLEVGLAVVVVDSILIGERLGGELLDLLVDCWRWGTIGGGALCEGNSHQGRGKGNLILGEFRA